MPLYEYQCQACAHRFEQIRRFSDPPLESCPECGGAVRKLVSSPAIQFKGTGWYVTDYAQQGRKDPSDAAEAKAGAPADGADPLDLALTQAAADNLDTQLHLDGVAREAADFFTGADGDHRRS